MIEHRITPKDAALYLFITFSFLSFHLLAAQDTDSHFPGYNEWERIAPEQAGMDRQLLDEAVRFSKEVKSAIRNVHGHTAL